MSTKLKSTITSSFKMHGLSLRSEASRYLVDVFSQVDEEDCQEWLDKIIEIVQKQPLTSSLIDKQICESAVQECNAEQDDESDKIFSVIDAFSVPRFTYQKDRKKFIPNSTLGLPAPCLHGNANDKANLFRERYTILQQRTLRHDLFTPPALGSAPDESKKFQLKPIEYLLGTTAKVGEVIVLGMLTQLKEGKWYLEDPTGVVQIDLSKANFHTGLFTENCFVLAEGWYEDEMFHVNAFGFPPPEPAKTTRSFFGNLNFFGGPSTTSVKASSKLQQIEQENSDAMFIILSDVWLDQIKVIEKLRVLFSGYSGFPPTCFIFCGNFLSSPLGTSHAKVLKECFEQLAELMCEFPDLIKSSKFLFIPGPQDPGPSTILPRPAIPNSVTEEIRKKVPSAIFASNPCRIQYCTQEIVVFREDIVTKMCRNCVKFPEDGDVPTHFTKTLVCQGHLTPLPLHVSPVYWAYDCGLRLYPLPDLVICADKHDPFHSTSVDCTVLNPGSFPRTDYSFKVYLPATRQIEDSKIED
ncbi:DNA polymerase epsilon subunit 2-like [Mercenaria mercenaria]|uniref:DNA polymerase epsilon subunit 2-like n=1 Tax=Mercenaria mercenaria TaxID=6596 RepID=UPI00234F7370|nr:DNA polymerase epsilon subunit 2-like [Mercenaria mercenaria]